MGSSPLPQNITLGGRASRREFLSQGWYFANEQTLLFGILLAITGNIFISISLNLQKYSHLRLTQQVIQKPCYRSKLWWCGIIFMGIGEIGNFAAYGFAPVMVVAPLGSVAVIGGAIIAVLFLKEHFSSQSILGGTVMLVGMFLLVTFAPHIIQKVTARTIQTDLVSWQFLIYMIVEIVAFCILLYFYKRKEAKHIVVLLTMVALLASLTIISVKAVAAMLTFSVKGNMQLTYPIFYLMLILMTSTCIFQVKFLNQAVEIYGSAQVIPLNYVLSTLSSILAGAMFYHEFQGAGFLSSFMSLFGCSLTFIGVSIISQNRSKEHLTTFYIDCEHIPGKKKSSTIQPDSNNPSYGSLYKESISLKTPTKE
ncbi:NIPA-like protein 2 [Notechis scutatus]|uniref:NIPA-like protein 2 n=1 Tax=Notechis scutatus TaxID=8663 RepID=A0A6J1W084_9SAUR|nr:NIPA-like protein 2 [Notechis scutatus]